jgi:ligand-binding sensor domain-containing protein/signal transduction histidine kinase
MVFFMSRLFFLAKFQCSRSSLDPPGNRHSRPVIFRTISFLLAWLILSSSSAQRYNFVHYGEGDGLVQSQISSLCQDSYRHLWVSTFGGICRFDGRTFINYTQHDGLINNFTDRIFADHQNKIWIGTLFGLSCFNGSTFKNYKFNKRSENDVINDILEDKWGRLWVIANFRLYQMAKDSFQRVVIDHDSTRFITAMQIDPSGVLIISVYKKGLYLLKDQQFELSVAYKNEETKHVYTTIQFDQKRPDTCWLLCDQGITLVSHQQILNQANCPLRGIKGRLNSMAEDGLGDLWVSSTTGLFRFNGRNIEQFNRQNGFTNNIVNSIFTDNENNVWFATNGEGIYRYSFDRFRLLDQSQGLESQLLMSILRLNKNHLWLATYSDGIFDYECATRRITKVVSTQMKAKHINCLYRDQEGWTWIATDNEGIWKWKEKSGFVRADNPQTGLVPVGTSITQDPAGNIWISSPVGCFRLKEGKTQLFLKNIFTSSLFAWGKDSVFIGTQRGLYLWTGDSALQKINKPLLNSSIIVCMQKKGDKLIIGTGDRGILTYEVRSGKLRNINSSNGLNSDFIYSLLVDSLGSLWVGGGQGINRIFFEEKTDSIKIYNYSEFGTNSAGECNQNAVMKLGNEIWFGTTKGALITPMDIPVGNSVPTHVVLQSVLLFGKEIQGKAFCDSISPWYNIPFGLKLPYNQNSLSFRFQGVGFRKNKEVLYQYKLEGSNKNVEEFTYSPLIVYPDLPAGKYRLLVRSFTNPDGYSENQVDFPFEIQAAFFNTLWFRTAGILVLIGIFLGIQTFRKKAKEKRERQMEDLKKEEEFKIRKRTSEDLHDEIGNKLTRISVLSDILQTQTQAPESKKILLQMKENIAALYSGTRDILWSLQPESDNLQEIIKRLGEFGKELFQETSILFDFRDCTGETGRQRLPSDVNLNILLIFKEGMTNILKHSACKKVLFQVSVNDANQWVFILQDDGIGFDLETVKKGHGIDNIQLRSRRIGGKVDIDPGNRKGTVIRLLVNNHPNQGIAV